MRKYLQKSPNDYAETVIDVVRVVVAEGRQTGLKTVALLDIHAPDFEERPRRLRQLFERDRIGFIGVNEACRFLLRGAGILRRIAQRHRELADQADAKASAFEAKEGQLRQLNLWGNGGGGWVGYDVRKQRRAA